MASVPYGFLFSVEMLNNSPSGSTAMEVGFQEVSGINATMGTEKITEGGENRFVHNVPARITYDSSLVLKRGLIMGTSLFGDWCRSHLSQGLNALSDGKKIQTKDIIVHLLDAETHDPIMSWAFARCYPLKWEVSTLNARQSDLVVESLTLSYAYFIVL